MFYRYAFKNRSLCLVFLMLLLLLGSAQGTWCFQTSPDIEALDTMVSDCRDAVPSACLTLERRSKSQNTIPIPSGCQSCIDLTFEKLFTTVIKKQNADFVFKPAIAHPHALIFDPPSSFTLRPFTPRPDRVFRSGLNIHRSIDSTVLII
jgi:hypothetical protein